MKLVVGLGNYGALYQGTRHNVGFIIVDQLVKHYDLSWSEKDSHYASICDAKIKGEKVIFAKPLTYMNLSGRAVFSLQQYYKIKISDIIVIHDDLDLKCFRVVSKYNGGTGGHNGIKSINEYLNDSSYLRLKFGIGRPADFSNKEEKDMAISQYVLSKFSESEFNQLDLIVGNIVSNFDLILDGEIGQFQAKFSSII